ncbi:MAG: DUF2948 family protein [Pseudorhodobacter sp.]|nr:MAG: DUF2948 family protein [Pseudorhodobacter sp.]
MTDARFEDGDETPLRLQALGPDDVPVLAALVQDAVFPITEMTYARPRRRFAILLNRFRWEDREAAARENRPFERVQALLSVENVTSVRTQGIDRAQKDVILSLLSVSYSGSAVGPGVVTLTLAGDGAIELAVEAPEIALRDTTRPYRAVSGKVPDHG